MSSHEAFLFVQKPSLDLEVVALAPFLTLLGSANPNQSRLFATDDNFRASQHIPFRLKGDIQFVWVAYKSPEK